MKDKSTNSSKNIYDDDNIPEIDLPKNNSENSKSLQQTKKDTIEKEK